MFIFVSYSSHIYLAQDQIHIAWFSCSVSLKLPILDILILLNESLDTYSEGLICLTMSLMTELQHQQSHRTFKKWELGDVRPEREFKHHRVSPKVIWSQLKWLAKETPGSDALRKLLKNSKEAQEKVREKWSCGVTYLPFVLFCRSGDRGQEQ